MKITICGGGSLGHVCAAVFSQNASVSLLTAHPERWQHRVVVTDPEGKTYEGHLTTISHEPSDVIPEADIVLLCVPGFLIEKTLLQIRPYLRPDTCVGSIVSSTGFFFMAHKVLTESTPLFGFQRVPFIARVSEYGRSANLLGYKSGVSVATENIVERECFRSKLERLLNTPTMLLESFYEATLTNSNPILHTARLYSMWHEWDGKPFDTCTLFYKEWTVKASELMIKMDEEFMRLLAVLPMRTNSIPTLLEYYESSDAASLTEKLRSIAAFQNIPSPMQETPEGWVPDFTSRYFTEDFPFGLRFIVDLCHEHNISIPTIENVYAWGMEKAK